MFNLSGATTAKDSDTLQNIARQTNPGALTAPKRTRTKNARTNRQQNVLTVVRTNTVQPSVIVRWQLNTTRKSKQKNNAIIKAHKNRIMNQNKSQDPNIGKTKTNPIEYQAQKGTIANLKNN